MVTHALELGERAHRIVSMRDGLILDDGHNPGAAGKRAEGPDPPEKVAK